MTCHRHVTRNLLLFSVPSVCSFAFPTLVELQPRHGGSRANPSRFAGDSTPLFHNLERMAA